LDQEAVENMMSSIIFTLHQKVQIKDDEMVRAEGWECEKNFVGKPEGKRLLRRPRNRWDNGKLGWEGVDWIDIAQDRDLWWAVVNMEVNLRVP
jgi:hypothetical protein